ncbi:MAG: carboxypeptidase regulatory-like domain-containing protein [Gemmatimonadota bacterium]
MLIGLAGCARWGWAQAVQGDVVTSDSSVSAHGAVILLLDSTGGRRGAAFTDEHGRFHIKAPLPGHYRLRLQRIGFQDIDTDSFLIPTAATTEKRIELALLPIEIPAITASAKRQCATSITGNHAAAALWREARKGLDALLLSELQRSYQFHVRRFTRRLELPDLRIRSDSSYERILRSDGSPFVSPPVRQLLESGFFERTDSGTFYHAPDPRVLVSDGFAQVYCFGATEDISADLVGLIFLPSARSGPPAIAGTLWLDRSSFNLERLDFSYTRINPLDWPTEHAGGTLHFMRLPNGASAIKKWSIRMPIVVQRELRLPGGVQNRLAAVGVVEEGGEVLQIDEGSASLSIQMQPSPVHTVIARLLDWDSGNPIVNANVLLMGVNIRALSDAEGRAIFQSVPIGKHELKIEHLAYPGFSDTVTVNHDRLLFEIRVPKSAIIIEPVAAKALSAVARARLARGSRADILVREQLAALENRARHIGDLVRIFQGLKVREIYYPNGGPLRGVCIESGRSAPALRRRLHNCNSVLVVVDDVPMRQPDLPDMRDWIPEALLHIAPAMVESIEFLPAAEAGARYGTGSSDGVVVIYTRGNGPYAKQPRN